MDDIFEPRRKNFFCVLRTLLPAVFPALLCILFLAAVSRTSEGALEKEQTVLLQALEHGAVQTYALTGKYPESLSQLLEEYHITYDRQKFVIEYIPSGSNLFPMISVLPLEEDKGGIL